jgi:hypothetical protein
MGTGLILIAAERELEKIRNVYPEAAVIGRLAKGSGVTLYL